MHKNFSFYPPLQNLCSSRFSLDHPGTRPLSAGPSLGPEHPGTRLATPRWRGANIFVWFLYIFFFFFSMQYTSLQSKSYSNSRYFFQQIKAFLTPILFQTKFSQWEVQQRSRWRRKHGFSRRSEHGLLTSGLLKWGEEPKFSSNDHGMCSNNIAIIAIVINTQSSTSPPASPSSPSSQVTSMSTSLGRPAPAVYQPPATPRYFLAVFFKNIFGLFISS